MPIAVLILAVSVYAYGLIAYPEFRLWGLILGAVLAIGVGIALWRDEIGLGSDEPAISAEELKLDNLELRRTPRSAALRGRVLNGSPDFRLREMTMRLRLFDCPDEIAAVETCPVIGDATAAVRPDTPPGQVRGFEALFVFTNLPSVAGVLRWDWAVMATRATR
jgi:hypothetical protein